MLKNPAAIKSYADVRVFLEILEGSRSNNASADRSNALEKLIHPMSEFSYIFTYDGK